MLIVLNFGEAGSILERTFTAASILVADRIVETCSILEPVWMVKTGLVIDPTAVVMFFGVALIFLPDRIFEADSIFVVG